MLSIKFMKKGISLYFAIIILSVLSTTLLALITISISQIKVIWTLGDSVVAFFAADTGIEQCLYRIRKGGNFDPFSGSINGASYAVTVQGAGSGGCDADNYCLKAIGSYKKTKRAIEATY